MNKKGMNLITLIFSVSLMIMIAAALTFAVSDVSVTSKIKDNMELENMQQMANAAYASIYFKNLRRGERRELTSSEIYEYLQKEGTSIKELAKYNIVVRDGDVFVTQKGK